MTEVLFFSIIGILLLIVGLGLIGIRSMLIHIKEEQREWEKEMDQIMSEMLSEFRSKEEKDADHS